MAIRRREKPLTQQEAIELVRREFHACWSGSEPLIAAVPTGGEIVAYPLDPRLSERLWLLFFLDPLAHSAHELVHYAGEWAARYEAQKLGAIAILAPRHSFVGEAQWIGRWSLRHQASFPVALDRDNLLARAFQVSERPKVLLLDQGQVRFQRSGRDWFNGLESLLQEYLRRSDPGLPLFPPFVPAHELCRDLGAIEPGRQDSGVLSGEWKTEGGWWIPQDARASLSFHCPGRRLGLVAQAAAGSVEIQVELGRELGKMVIAGSDLELLAIGNSKFLRDPRDRCRAKVKVEDARLYRLFESLPETHRDVTLRFPGLQNGALSLCSLRFAE